MSEWDTASCTIDVASGQRRRDTFIRSWLPLELAIVVGDRLLDSAAMAPQDDTEYQVSVKRLAAEALADLSNRLERYRIYVNRLLSAVYVALHVLLLLSAVAWCLAAILLIALLLANNYWFTDRRRCIHYLIQNCLKAGCDAGDGRE